MIDEHAPEIPATGPPLDGVPTRIGNAGVVRLKERARAYVDPVTGEENLTYAQLTGEPEDEE